MRISCPYGSSDGAATGAGTFDQTAPLPVYALGGTLGQARLTLDAWVRACLDAADAALSARRVDVA